MKHVIATLCVALCALIGTEAQAQAKGKIVPERIVAQYAWEGYLDGEIHFRLELERLSNDLVIGETTYFRKNGKVADIPVYGRYYELEDAVELVLSEYDNREECGQFFIILDGDELKEGTWSLYDKEMQMTDVQKVGFSDGKHETFIYPAMGSSVSGKYGFKYYKDKERTLDGGGFAQLSATGNGKVRWQISRNVGGIAEANGTSPLVGNTFWGKYKNFSFKAYVYRDCLYVVRTNPDDGQVEDWGVAGSIEGIYLRH